MGLGTSETIRLFTTLSEDARRTSLPYTITSEWLAGLIDGDGCFLLSKKGYASLEITKSLADEHALSIIKNRYGGSIKLRSGVSALRYRLHHKAGFFSLISDVNGFIRSSTRMIQLSKICHKYEIPFLYPSSSLKFFNGWVTGFFDANGTVTYNKYTHQLTISISQKDKSILDPLIQLYGGNVYIDNGKSLSYKWSLSKTHDLESFLPLFEFCSPKSAKKSRIHLILKIIELKKLNAHKADASSVLGKAWLKIISKW